MGTLWGCMQDQNKKPILKKRAIDFFPHFLVVDDDVRLRELLEAYLEQEGFIVTTAENSFQAQEIIKQIRFDLFILDVMMPGQTGYDLCSFIRKESEIPILFLTAKAEIEDKLQGFEVGGDDYLPKPFEPRELIARIQSLLKREKRKNNLLEKNKKEEIDNVIFGSFVFHLKNDVLYQEGLQVFLTETEKKLLKVFLHNAFCPQSRENLAALFSGTISPRSIDVQVARLRRKIEKNPKRPRYLQTSRHKGYVFIPE